MRTISYIRSKVFLVILLSLIVSGCATTEPSRFYTLHASEDLGTIQQSSAYKYTVAIGPVEIPDYLDRPQIVSRTNQNEITFSEFQRWAGSLEEDISRVLSENLTLLLSGDSVSVSLWEWGATSDYRIAVHIRRFDIMPEGDVLLSARCTLIDSDGRTQLLTWEARVTETITAQTYDAKVSSMSRALEKLSEDIAGKIRDFSQNNDAKKNT